MLGVLAIALIGTRAGAADGRIPPLLDPTARIATAIPHRLDDGAASAKRPIRLARKTPDAPPLDQRWRARGVAFVDLPFGMRARYDAQTLHRPVPGNELEAASFDRSPPLDRSTGAVGRARLLESRFTLSHALAHHVEIELSFSARSPLSRVDLLRIEDQRVAAMIRFVP